MKRQISNLSKLLAPTNKDAPPFKPGQQPSFQPVQLEITEYLSEFLFTPVTCDQVQQVPLIWAGGDTCTLAHRGHIYRVRLKAAGAEDESPGEALLGIIKNTRLSGSSGSL